MLLIGAGYRAFFAPYNPALGSGQASTALGPTILDLATLGPFNTNAPPAGFTDLGWVKDFKVTPASKIGQVRSGYRGAVRAQYRGQVAESFEFKFREASRMAYKIATGTDPINLLATTAPQSTTTGPVGATGAVSIAMSSYSPTPASAPTLTLATAPSGAGIVVGTPIVCDIDYDLVSYGIIGEAGVPVFNGAVADVDYIRRTSDFVARVVAINGNVLTLDQPFVGGGSSTSANPNGPAPTQPPAASKVQAIRGWASREGGTFITEWSGLFLLDTVDQAQIAFYCPHVSISQYRGEQPWAIENVGTTDLTGYELDCVMECLAFDDPLDGETVVAYHAFYLRPGSNVAI